MNNPVIRLVDDDAVLRHSLTFLLQAEGWDVREYAGGEAFLTEDALADAGTFGAGTASRTHEARLSAPHHFPDRARFDGNCGGSDERGGRRFCRETH